MTDSDNVRSWLTKRRPRNPFARLMICLVQRLEAEYNFSCHAVYIRTYHTEMADWISRTPVDEVTSSMMARGWAKVDCLEFWETLLIGATHTAMVLLGGDPLRQKARQLALPVSTLPAPLRVWLHQPWVARTRTAFRLPHLHLTQRRRPSLIPHRLERRRSRSKWEGLRPGSGALPHPPHQEPDAPAGPHGGASRLG